LINDKVGIKFSKIESAVYELFESNLPSDDRVYQHT